MINDNNYHPRPEAEGANTSALHIYIYSIKALQGMVRLIIFQLTVLILKHLLENK